MITQLEEILSVSDESVTVVIPIFNPVTLPSLTLAIVASSTDQTASFAGVPFTFIVTSSLSFISALSSSEKKLANTLTLHVALAFPLVTVIIVSPDP